MLRHATTPIISLKRFTEKFFCDCGEGGCQPIVPNIIQNEPDANTIFYDPEKYDHDTLETKRFIENNHPQRFRLSSKFIEKRVLLSFKGYKVRKRQPGGYVLYELKTSLYVATRDSYEAEKYVESFRPHTILLPKGGDYDKDSLDGHEEYEFVSEDMGFFTFKLKEVDVVE